MLVEVCNVGLPFVLASVLLWTPGILRASFTVGPLVGVFLIGRRVAPPQRNPARSHVVSSRQARLGRRQPKSTSK